MGQYVGIDLHRRSTTIVRMAEDGEVLGTERFVSQPFELAQAMAAAGPEPEVVLESTYGWYWAADVLQELGAHVHLAHALGNNWGNRRSRTTSATPRTWPPCWPSGVWPRAGSRRQRSESCASWCAIATRSSGTAPVPRPRSTGSWPRTGSCPSSASCGARPVRPNSTASSSPRPTPCASTRCATCSTSTRRPSPSSTRTSTPSSRPTPAIGPLMTLPGVGKVIAAIFVAEIGDISRFDSAKKLCSWAGLTPKHRESDEVVHRGAITKQGSPLVRWAAIEAVGNYRAKGNEKLRADYKRIAEHAGKYKARVAVARKLLTLVFYALRDGEVRCLEAAA